MFRASSCPSSGATTTAVAASGLPLELDDSSAVGRGRAGRLLQTSSHKATQSTAVVSHIAHQTAVYSAVQCCKALYSLTRTIHDTTRFF